MDKAQPMTRSIAGVLEGSRGSNEAPPPLIRYCLYARKSSDESSERQVMSIDSQVKEMLELAQRDGLSIVEIKREAHSAKNAGERSVFNEMIREIRAGKFNGVVTWAPDRLARNSLDFSQIIDLLDNKLLIEVRTHTQRFTNNPNEKFMLMIVGAQGKLENDQKGLNVKRGLRAKCEMGLWPAPAMTGYLNEMRTDRKGYVIIDPVRGPIVTQMFEKVGNDGWSGRKVYRWLHEIGFKTVNNGTIWLSSVQKILRTSFYMGEFQYPAGTGKWYVGKHEPLTSKEIFQRAQEVMKRESEFRYMSKDFAFTRLMKCGLCGAGITAQEKHKQLKNGGTATYIYYGCTRTKNLDCPIAYLREEDLIVQLMALIDNMSMDALGLRKNLREDIERHNKFQAMLGAEAQKIHLRDVDLKNYAKHVLNTGTTQEKRDVLAHLKDRLILKDRRIALE
ncbi:MAG: recombinase family protein [bacterium]|nr:recombinase family protein [bacterium]